MFMYASYLATVAYPCVEISFHVKKSFSSSSSPHMYVSIIVYMHPYKIL